MFVSVLELTIAPTVSLIVSASVTPAIVIASASSVPSISASPLISNVAASNSPLIVIFLPPVISLFESVIIALLAITVPFVIPSIRFISVALAVTPSKMFNSAAVLVTPSRILSSAAVEVKPSNMFS